MGRKYAIRNHDKFYFVTFTLVYWLDVFIRNEYRSIFIDSVKYCQREKGLLVGAWCIMTSHVHMVIGANGKNSLPDIIRDLKSYTSRHVRKHIEYNQAESRSKWLLWMMAGAGRNSTSNSDFQFWQHHNHPIELSMNNIIDQRVAYIHNNHVEAGFVHNPSDWVFSSASDYEGAKGLFDIYFLD